MTRPSRDQAAEKKHAARLRRLGYEDGFHGRAPSFFYQHDHHYMQAYRRGEERRRDMEKP